MERAAVVQYDLSRSAGWAVYAPGRAAPRHGVLKLPPTTSAGDNGPALKLLFDHIAWVDRNFGLAAIGYEAFLAPTGGKSDKGKGFVTSPKTLKRLAGYMAVVEMSAAIMEIPIHEINQASWTGFWLGSLPRGTDRAARKRMAVEKARNLGWAPHGDDDADALGQLHYLLEVKLAITVPWKTRLAPDLVELRKPMGPLNV